MLDLFDIPSATKADVQKFGANSVTAGSSWHTWRKPRGISFIHILLFGGGGGGGGGFVGAAGAAGGGGGGGSSAQTNILFPAWAIPDVLYISVGVGGAGSTGSTVAGSNGIVSYISIDPSTTANNLLAIASAGGGGGAGTAAAGGALGTAGAASAVNAAPLSG